MTHSIARRSLVPTLTETGQSKKEAQNAFKPDDRLAAYFHWNDRLVRFQTSHAYGALSGLFPRHADIHTFQIANRVQERYMGAELQVRPGNH
jgi:hypothetical protein